MARYRKIDPRIWKDEKFRMLAPMEKLIGIYLFTAQSNRIGIFNFSPGMACEDLQMSPETFAKGFGKVVERLFLGWDQGLRILYLPRWWKYNSPENPNVLKACLADLSELPQTPLLQLFCNNLAYLPETFHQTFREGLPKPSPNQEQEQKQKQEQKFLAAEAANTVVQQDEPEVSDMGADPKSPPATPRKRNELFDAVVELTGADPSIEAQAAHIGKVCSILRKANPPYTPDEVRSLPAALAANFDKPFAITLGVIPKHIHLVRSTPKVFRPEGGRHGPQPPRLGRVEAPPGKYDRFEEPPPADSGGAKASLPPG